MLRPFSLHEPDSVEGAVSLLARLGEDARAYAGGTELLLAMKEGLLRYSHLVNIKTIPGMDELSYSREEGQLHIGAAATHRTLELSPTVLEEYPLIAEVESRVANVRVRNVGTIGGNLCFAEPHSDPCALFLLHDAQVQVQGSGGTRSFPVAELTRGPYETSLAEDELLTRVLVPKPPQAMKGTYIKFGYHERPTVGLGVAVRLDGATSGSPESRTVDEVRIAVGSVGPRAVRATQAEELLQGKSLEQVFGPQSGGAPSLIEQAGQLAADEASPMDDLHGSAEYKEHLVKVFLRRALIQVTGFPEPQNRT